MDHLFLNITPEHRANLEKLADHLERVDDPAAFDMHAFAHMRGDQFNRPDPSEMTHYAPCETVCCALGHGPHAGIPALPDGEAWHDYSARAFGILMFGRAYTWLFSDNWTSVDNTPRGAAARIRYALAYGIPWNFRHQSMGLAPRSYRAGAGAIAGGI